MSPVSLLRKLLVTRDERGRTTSDRFRLAVRKTVRGMVVDVAGRILDCGGGDGLLFDPQVSTLGSIVTVLDLDERSLKEGRRAYSGNGAFVCGDMTAMPFPDGFFDTSVCIGTLYNFPSGDTVMRGIAEMARVTADNGRILLEFRNADNPVVTLAYRHAAAYDSSLKGLPLNAYRIGDIRSMLEELDLEAKHITYIGIPLRHLAFGFIVTVSRRENGEL